MFVNSIKKLAVQKRHAMTLILPDESWVQELAACGFGFKRHQFIAHRKSAVDVPLILCAKPELCRGFVFSQLSIEEISSCDVESLWNYAALDIKIRS